MNSATSPERHSFCPAVQHVSRRRNRPQCLAAVLLLLPFCWCPVRVPLISEVCVNSQMRMVPMMVGPLCAHNLPRIVLRFRAHGTREFSSRRKPLGKYYRRTHLHICYQCGLPYAHYHGFFKRGHSQFPFQCPWECCQWFFGKGDSKHRKNKSCSSHDLASIATAYKLAASIPQRSSNAKVTASSPRHPVWAAPRSLASICNQGLIATSAMRGRVVLQAKGGEHGNSIVTDLVDNFTLAETMLNDTKRYQREPPNSWLRQAGIENVFNSDNESYRRDFMSDVKRIIKQPMPSRIVQDAVDWCLHRSFRLWSDFVNCVVFDSFTAHALGAKNFSRSPQVCKLLTDFWQSRKDPGSCAGNLLQQEVQGFRHDNLQHGGQDSFRGDWTHNWLNIIVPGFVNPAIAVFNALSPLMANGSEQWQLYVSDSSRAHELVESGLDRTPPLKSLKRKDVCDGSVKKITISSLHDAGVKDASFGFGRGRCPAIQFSKMWLRMLVQAIANCAAVGRFSIVGREARTGLAGDIYDFAMAEKFE